MNLAEAHEYIDILLDKADQPYFIEEEKNKFLNLAISDFINGHYQKMTADEDSRRALSGCIDWQSFSLSKSAIIAGTAIYGSSYPALSGVYDDTTASDTKGYFLYGNHYVLPKQHLYVLSLGVSYYNKDAVIDPSTGQVYSGVTQDDIIFSPTVSIKNKSTKDYYEHAYTNDPFNKAGEDAPYWSYIENRIIIGGSGSSIRYINMQVITLPTVDQAFSEATWQSSTAPVSLTFAEHYQKQIIQMAVKRMTQTDVGLMTPPSN
jgi:hypothetical protein